MKQGQDCHILVIDDNPAIHEDFQKILGGVTAADRGFLLEKEDFFEEEANDVGFKRFRIDSAYQGQEGLALVEKAWRSGDRYALAFVDIRMPPGWDGVETITRLWGVDPKLQIVICSAYSDYSWDQMVRRLGHSDNFVILKKPFDNIEVIQLAHALTTKWSLAKELESRLEHAKNAARLSEERFSAAFQSSPMPMSIQILRTRQLLEANDQFIKVSGFSRPELLDPSKPKHDLWVPGPESPSFWELLDRGDRVREFPCSIQTKAGELRPARVFAELLQFGNEPLVLVVTEDISEQVRIEGQLRQAQKMDAVGQLAAGIAHDFNNQLTLILGHLSLILESQSFEPPIDKSIRQALRAGQKAATLTCQLLAFSRKQVIERSAVYLTELFRELDSLLQRVLGEHIRVSFSAPADLDPVHADPGNLEQVILNLAVNARDAMPNGGELRIHAEPVQVSEPAAERNPDAAPGAFIRLTVSDTGCGMDEATKARAFEPFFTTKEKGKGTGMGLAMVYGIIKQHQGWIDLESQPGLGTTFSIFLPVSLEAASGQHPGATLPKIRARHGGETILVVEDEEPIAEYVRTVLEGRGYRVLLAQDGIEALRVWEDRKEQIDLLLTDIVMPNGISGKDLAERLSAQAPALRVVLTSGYSLDILGLDPKLGANNYLLQKPYQSDVLLDTIRKALDEQAAGRSRVINDRWSE